MANWVSIKAAAEMYGTTEEKIRSLIRLRYINFTFADDSHLINDDDTILKVDIDSINKTLDLNTVLSLEEIPKDNSIVKVPIADLEELLRTNAEYREIKATLLDELKITQESERKHKETSIELSKLSSQLIALQLKMTQDIEKILNRKDEGIFSFLRKLFTLKSH